LLQGVCRRRSVACEPKCCHELHKSREIASESWRLVAVAGDESVGLMRIRLIRKLADKLDGIDVSGYAEGDLFELALADAELLIAEGWAVRDSSQDVRGTSFVDERALAADRAEPRTQEQLRRIREQMDSKRLEQHERRRAEDRIREAHHDSRSKTVSDKK
jgi:hypothetical protein